MFEKYGHRPSSFDSNSKKILGLFIKWKDREKKAAYIHHFSKANWDQLPEGLKQQHTLSNCKQCADQHYEFQQGFPGKKLQPSEKCFMCTAKQQINVQGEVAVTTGILKELEPLYKENYGHTFTESLTSLPGSQLQPKPSYVDKKKKKRAIQRECRDRMQAQYQNTDALTILAENVSLQSYNRIRLAQSFESPVCQACQD